MRSKGRKTSEFKANLVYGIHSEFQNSHNYVERFCLNKTKQNETKKKLNQKQIRLVQVFINGSACIAQYYTSNYDFHLFLHKQHIVAASSSSPS